MGNRVRVQPKKLGRKKTKQELRLQCAAVKPLGNLAHLSFARVEKRGPRAENKAVTDTTFIGFRGPKAPKRTDGMRRPVSTGCDKLPMIDVLKAQRKGDRQCRRLALCRRVKKTF